MGYLIAALLGGFFAFNAKATPDKAARVIQSTLQRQFATQNVQVEVEGRRGMSVVKGRFRRVRISMSRFVIPAAPTASIATTATTSAQVSPVGAGASATAISDTRQNIGFSVRAIPGAKSEGRVETFELALRDFRWNGLPVASLDMTLRDVAFDWKSLRKRSEVNLVRVGPGTAQLHLAADALMPFLKSKLSDVSEPKLQLMADNRVRIEGSKPAPLLNVPLPFSVDGRLGARNGNELWLEEASISMGGVPLAAPLAKAFTGDLNPIYVFDREGRAPFRLNIQSLQTSAVGLDIAAALRFVPVAGARENK